MSCISNLNTNFTIEVDNLINQITIVPQDPCYDLIDINLVEPTCIDIIHFGPPSILYVSGSGNINTSSFITNSQTSSMSVLSASYALNGGTLPGGPNRSIQFNHSSSLSGSNSFRYDSTGSLYQTGSVYFQAIDNSGSFNYDYNTGHLYISGGLFLRDHTGFIRLLTLDPDTGTFQIGSPTGNNIPVYVYSSIFTYVKLDSTPSSSISNIAQFNIINQSITSSFKNNRFIIAGTSGSNSFTPMVLDINTTTRNSILSSSLSISGSLNVNGIPFNFIEGTNIDITSGSQGITISSSLNPHPIKILKEKDSYIYPSDYILWVDSPGRIGMSPDNVYLPENPPNGTTFIIKDGGKSENRPFTVKTVGTNMFEDSSTSYTVERNFYSFSIFYLDDFWYFVSSYIAP
jgi:hypothetical protein